MDFERFEAYYSDRLGFALHFGQMFRSYIERIMGIESCRFHGFGVDQLTNLDTIYMNNEKGKLVLPTEKDAIYFICGVWIMVATDILVYNKYPEKVGLWQRLTNYPKFTGWNYYATHPAYVCGIIAERYAKSVGENVECFMQSNKDILLNSIIDDICNVLRLSKKDEYDTMYRCLCSMYLSSDMPAAFDVSWVTLECFRDSKKYFRAV